MSTLKIGAIVVIVCWFALIAAATCTMAHDAADHPSLAGWAEEQLVTPEYGAHHACPDVADKGNNNCKCCAQSEIVKAEFRISRDRFDERGYAVDEYWYKPDGKDEWIRIPDDVVHWGEHAPDGQPTLFAIGAHQRCFFPGKTDQ